MSTAVPSSIAALFAVALASCDAPLDPPQPSNLDLSRARTVHEVTSVPIYEDVDCTASGGEYIELAGTIHTNTQVVVKGQSALVMVHHSVSGVTGTGLTTGLRYRGTGSSKQITHARTGSTPVAYTLIDRTHLVQTGANGAGSIWALKVTTHLTISPSGQVNFQDREEVICEVVPKPTT